MNPVSLSLLAAIGAGTLLLSTTALSQAPSGEADSLEDQLADQLEHNEALRRRIAALEEVLSSDVCSNADAPKLLRDRGSDAGG